MRKGFLLLALLPALIFGMAEPPNALSETKDVKVLVIDRKGTNHILKSPMCGGRPYLKVNKGTLEYSISLKSVKRIVVGNVKGDSVELIIETKDGKTDTFTAPAFTLCTMESNLGKVSFSLKDVKEIILQGEGR